MKLGAYGTTRGNLVRFDEEGWVWVYADTLGQVSLTGPRPCTRCGKIPTAEGHDACLGTLGGGVGAACCGHGIEPPSIVFDDGSEMVGDEAQAFMKRACSEEVIAIRRSDAEDRIR